MWRQYRPSCQTRVLWVCCLYTVCDLSASSDRSTMLCNNLRYVIKILWTNKKQKKNKNKKQNPSSRTTFTFKVCPIRHHVSPHHIERRRGPTFSSDLSRATEIMLLHIRVALCRSSERQPPSIEMGNFNFLHIYTYVWFFFCYNTIKTTLRKRLITYSMGYDWKVELKWLNLSK